MPKLSIFAIAAILLSISIVASAEKYEFGSYNVSFRYPTPVVIINNNTTYENNSTIYWKKFMPLLEEARIFSPLLAKLGGRQSGQVDAIDLEYFYIYLYKFNKSIEDNVSSEVDQMLLDWEKNNSTFFGIWDVPFAGKTVASKASRPYPGFIITGPLENGLSFGMYFGFVNNLTAIYVFGQCPPDSFEAIRSTMKITPRENLEANEKPKKLKSSELILPKVELLNPELPNKEDTMPFSWKIKSFREIAPILIGIISIIISVLMYVHSQKRKSLGYELLAEVSLLTVKKDLHGKIKIFFEDKLIQDAWHLIYKITNNGDVPINDRDFKAPISISFGNGTTILDAEISSTTPKNLKANLNIINANEIILDPLLMNSLDSIIINVFLSGYRSGASVAPVARIEGINQIEYINEHSDIKNRNLRSVLYISFFMLLVIVLSSLNDTVMDSLISILFMIIILIIILYRYKPKLLYKLILLSK
jgi:hypothetical protein